MNAFLSRVRVFARFRSHLSLANVQFGTLEFSAQMLPLKSISRRSPRPRAAAPKPTSKVDTGSWRGNRRSGPETSVVCRNA
jgi:hypothetical protein